MADADAVRGAGVPDRLPAPDPGLPGAAPAPPPGAVMTLVDHLSELRSRLIKSVITVVAGSAIGFLFAPNIRHLLVAPLPEGKQQLIVLGPGDGFAITLRIAIAVGIILAMP
ncbi:MAG TPA: twin-arginine translocase subunit TatC, partial [Candidatus Limnocylindrales bacterium]|nr:twin-arginine translocase subunit TatC [Candidatus Limnocylindrales bacterium]